MQKALLPFLLAIALASSSFAQSSDTLRLDREIGFSTNILINGIFNSSTGPVDLSYKKKLNNSWIRWGLSLSAYQNSNFSPGHSTSEEKSFFVSPSIGLEKRKEISSKWLFLYGTDLLITTNYRKNTYTQTNNPDFITLNEDDYTAIGGGLRPFLGIGFNITPRLYLSTEASALLSASHVKRSSETRTPSSAPLISEADGWNSSIGLRPASAIFFYYRF